VALVSIGLPVYNGEKYLREAVESALGQTHSELELIISDNASTDRTAEIAREYAARDQRVRYFRNDYNLGPIANFNRAFRLARGDFFKWLSYDDVCMPELVQRCVAVLEADPKVVAATTRFREIGADGEPIGEQQYTINLAAPRPYQRVANLMSTPAGHPMLYGVIRADALSRTRLMAPYQGSDRALLAELCLLGPIVELPEVTWLSRDHPDRSPQLLRRQDWDPSRKPAQIRHLAIARHMSRVILTEPLPASERALCMAEVIKAAIRRSGDLLPVFLADLSDAVRYRARQLLKRH
jgi:glycosyltransferase involved in cell wall biosynthesis